MTSEQSGAAVSTSRAGMTSPRVGVVVIGHGTTASVLLDAARGVVGEEPLADVVAIDAGEGRDEALDASVCAQIDRVDAGRGVVVLVDLLGSSPFVCGQQEAREHQGTVVSGLNLAMLCKLATLDRSAWTAEEIAAGVAASGRRSVNVTKE